MIHCLRSLRTISVVPARVSFAMGKDNRKKTPADLENYDVVWVGANLGGIASTHFDKASHGKYTQFVVYDHPLNQMSPVRVPYEQQQFKKSQFFQFSKLAINKYTPSEMSSLKQVLPEENAIVLANGRRIGYKKLVLATGLKSDFSLIPGFTEALEHPEHPVYSSRDPDCWKGEQHKYAKYATNYKSGNGYFCIPEYPYAGEVECFNFFVTDDVWKWATSHGALSPKHEFLIVNANEKFVTYCDSADAFIKDQCAKRGIRVEYNTKLEKIDMNTNKATFLNLKTGERSERDYHNLYSMVPSKKQEFLTKASLVNDNGLLNVDHQTLQHRSYPNIFGLGDVCDLPTTKTFWAGWYQIAVLRNNIQRSLENKTLNAHYDGFSKVPIFTGNESITYVAHTYGGEGNWQHLKHTNQGLLAGFRYNFWAKKLASKFLNFYLGNELGPPYHKILKTFPELPGTPEAANQPSGIAKLLSKSH